MPEGLFRPDLQATLEHYGVYVQSYGAGWVKVLCPRFDHDERRPSATVNLDAGKWNCFVCDAHGDALDLISYNEGIDRAGEAAEWARNHGLPGSDAEDAGRFRRKSSRDLRGQSRDQRQGSSRAATRVRAGRWH